jgi:hypothetical protein
LVRGVRVDLELNDRFRANEFTPVNESRALKGINPSGSRVEIGPKDSAYDVLSLVSSPNLRVLQLHEPLPQLLFQALNEDLFSARPDVELRAYGFYGKTCDLAFCSLLTNVRRFRADCLQNAIGVENLARMSKLIALGIGIYDLESFEVLNDLDEGIQEISLSATKSRKPDLKHLTRFKSLTQLVLAGQQKNIEFLAEHPTLEQLTLRSITVPTLGWVRTIPRLWLLDIGLGGSKDLSAIAGMVQLKSLDLWRVLGLDDLSAVSSLTRLQKLQLQDLTHIQKLPVLAALMHLRRIVLDNLKNLTDISAITDVPDLAEIAHYSAKVEPEDYVPLFRRQKLAHAQMGFGGTKKNIRFAELCHEYGIKTGALAPFTFR